MNKIIVLFLLSMATSCSILSGAKTTAPKNPRLTTTEVDISTDELNIKIFRNDTLAGDMKLGFGYDIFRGNVLYIHQPKIPAIQGNIGFSTEEKAKQVADLMHYKIKNNIIPPSISIQELDSLGVMDNH
jgi:hypothetical protein